MSVFTPAGGGGIPITVNQGSPPWIINVTQFGSNNVVTGTGTSGLGIPRVTVSSDSSLTNITGTISLPTGASTSANQTTEIASLQIIDDIPHAQNAAFVKGVPMMGQLDDTSTVVATEDNVSVARITAQRAVHTNLRNNAGTEIATSANPLRIDPTGTTAQPSTQSGNWSVRVQDGSGTAITSTSFNSKQYLDSNPNTAFSTASNTRPAINNVSAVLLAANTNRKYVMIFNQSGATIFIKMGATAVINEGIRLANNEWYEITADNLWVGTINAIKSGAASVNVDVFEGTP